MDTRAKVELAAGILVLATSLVGFRSWLAEHDLRIRSEAETAATKSALDKQQEIRDQEKNAEVERDRLRDASNAQTLAEVAKLKTSAQLAAYANREVPGAQAVDSTPAPEQGSKPDAPAPKPTLTLDALALDTRLGACKVAETNLATCNADLAGRSRDAAAADEQIRLLKKENGDLQGELGHTKWSHVWNNYVKPGVALAIGIAAGRASR